MAHCGLITKNVEGSAPPSYIGLILTPVDDICLSFVLKFQPFHWWHQVDTGSEGAPPERGRGWVAALRSHPEIRLGPVSWWWWTHMGQWYQSSISLKHLLAMCCKYIVFSLTSCCPPTWRRIAQTDLDIQGSHTHHARTRSSCAWTMNGRVHGETILHNNVNRMMLAWMNIDFHCY